MSTVKTEPFYFGSEEDNIQIDPEKLPGATQKQEDTKEVKADKPIVTEESTEVEEPETIEQTEEDVEDDNTDSFDFFGGADKKKTKKEEVKDEKLTSDKIEYKAFKDFLIEAEIWKDFEGSDEIEYTEENFKALWKAQAENSVKEYLTEERAQFGGAANQLIDYLKDGGTVEDFASNYTQQIDIASIDTKEEAGQERAIKEYYKSIDWSEAKIKKHLERLKDSGDTEFQEEAEDCKTKLVKAIESDREEMLKEQEEIAKDRKLRMDNFNKQVRESIYKDADLADREKKELDKFIFDYKYQDNQGNKYSEFAVKMGEINSDPVKYSKFLKFVKNIESFEDKKVTEKKEAKKQWQFLKEGANPLAGATSQDVVKQNKTTSSPAFKFK